MANTSSRLSLIEAQGTDQVAELRQGILNHAQILDNAGMYLSGTLSNRPSASTVANGTVYKSTDTGDLSWSNGASWDPMERQANKGASSGYADLDTNGHVPLSRLHGITYSILDPVTVQPFLIPSGMLMPGAMSSAPAGWLVCDGSPVSRTTYSTLFAAISTSYGTGDGSTTFNVPDLRGRAPIGASTWANQSPSGSQTGTASGAQVWTLGSQPSGSGTRGGEETHGLSISELAAHTHTINGSGTGVSVQSAGTGISGTNSTDFAGNADAELLTNQAFASVVSGGNGTGGTGYSPHSTDANFGSMFSTHNHGISDPGHSHGISDPGHSHGMQPTGSGTGHNTVGPVSVVNWFIKA